MKKFIMRKFNRKTVRTKAVRRAAALFMAVGLIVPMMSTPAMAAYDEAKTVQMTDDEIDNSTLVIGTHLIYISAMDSQIYNIAKNSADESGQTNVYYKSELENGTWYDITGASTISDISTAGTPVDKSVIEKLHFNYYTMKDGLTYDLNSNASVDIFDIDDPYDANGFSELSELKSAYLDLKKKNAKSDSDKYIQSQLEEFYAGDLKTRVTDEYDDELDGLQAYYDSIAGQDNMKSRSATVHSVMEAVDAARRAEVFKKLSESTLQTLIKKLDGTSSASSDDLPDGFTANTEVNTAAADALEAIQESYVVYSNKMFTEGTTALGKQEYSYAQKLISAASDGDQNSCDIYADKLTDLSNIADNQIVNEDSEAELIDDDLLDEADSEYINALGGGAGSEYQTAYENGGSKSVLDRKLKQKLSEVDDYRTELQFVIKARTSRMSNDKAQKFVEKRIDSMTNFENAIQSDAFESYAKQSLSSYKQYLTGLLKDLVEKSSEGSEMAKLQKQKDELLLTKQDQLDNNDLSGAKETDTRIDAINTQMDTLENQLSLVIYSTTSSESEKAAAKANLGSVSVASDIDAVKQNILDAIADGDADTIDQNLDGLSSLISGNKDAGMSALKEISSELTVAVATAYDSSAMKNELQKVKTIISDHSDILLSSLTEDEIDSLVSDIFGSAYDDLDNTQKVSVLMALSGYIDETKDDAAENFLITKSQSGYDAGNQYIYSKLSSESDVFVSIRALSLCSGYRYIFSDTQQKCILKNSGSFYSFKANDKEVKRSAAAEAGGSSSGDDELSAPAEFQGCIYIPADYVSEQFSFTAEYLNKTDFGVLSTDDMAKDADTFKTALEGLADK